MVDPIIYVHIQNVKTTDDIWDTLKLTFEDSGFTCIVGLLRILITTRLESCASVEEYVNKIVGTAHKLVGINFSVSEEWIGTLLLAGLPDDYRPMIMGIENCGSKITGDFIKTKLLQDVKIQKTDLAFYSNTSNSPNNKNKFSNKRPLCFRCKKHGHKAPHCKTLKKNEKSETQCTRNSQAKFCTVCLTGLKDSTNLYVDSGASMHMNMRDW